MSGIARSWTTTRHSRGARLVTALRKGGPTVADLREFLAKVDEAGVSGGADFRYSASNLTEGGSRIYTFEVSEDFTPEGSVA